MSEFKYPAWMNIFPAGFAVIVGLIGASGANKSLIIFGIPVGVVAGFAVVFLLLKLGIGAGKPG